MRKYLRVALAWLGDEMSRRRLLRLCLIAGMLAGLFAHGFMFANKIPNHDDLYYDVDISGAGVESGRFALFFFWKLFSNLSAPWLNGILGVGFLSCAAALLSDAFGLRRRWQALSLTLIVVVFPENISLFCFMYEAHVFALGVMFAALAAWLVPRGRFEMCIRDRCMDEDNPIYDNAIACMPDGWLDIAIPYAVRWEDGSLILE